MMVTLLIEIENNEVWYKNKHSLFLYFTKLQNDGFKVFYVQKCKYKNAIQFTIEELFE